MANKKNNFSIYWIYAVLGVGLIAFQLFMGKEERSSVKIQSLLEIADESGVQNVVIINEKIVEFQLNSEGVDFVKKTENKELQKIPTPFANVNVVGCTVCYRTHKYQNSK